jgi:Protein of unknown function (DUF3617)
MKALALLLALALSALADAGQSEQLAPADLLRAMGLEPGRWQTEMRILTLDLAPAAPGGALPQGAQESARSAIGKTHISESCIGTGLDADGALVVPGIRIRAGCSVDRLEATDGRLRLVSSCGRVESGFHAETRIDATYARSSMAGTVAATVYSAAGGGIVTRTSVAFTSTHLGACG